ncbi:MAG: family 10 glycosylhydrolase [Maribacter sp.]|nr:family 10 glycosylhydrolase [Maribacter sp.]
MIKKTSLLLLVLCYTSCSVFKPIPQPKNEFRGVWVATVVNIDWPKSGQDLIEKQKKDFLEILDFYEDLNFNAVIVQVRTAGDAFYKSNYAPWSRFLTGKEGTSSVNEYDLLEWMINESHNRGFEFHAWLNPYRATFDLKTDVLSPIHDFNLHPEWMLKYGKKYYYNPGIPEVRDRLVAVMDEVITSYDIDAIHFDDYFYPYKIKNEVFQDSLSYTYHALPKQSLDDWRRSNVDSLVMNIHKTIKSRKPWVQFGISPFGVWKNKSTDPKGSDTKAGQTTYEDLYADPITWMENGWIDYLVPQVYWSMDLPVASHFKIVDWWSKNSSNTNLYIGNGAYKIRNNSDKAWENKKELPNQLKLARNTQAVKGNVFFSAKSLMTNKNDVVEHIKKKYYKTKALPPISPLSPINKNEDIEFDTFNKENGLIQLNFKNLEHHRYAMVYSSGRKIKSEYPMKKLISKVPVKENQINLPATIIDDKKQIALTFITKFGQESAPILIQLNQKYD